MMATSSSVLAMAATAVMLPISVDIRISAAMGRARPQLWIVSRWLTSATLCSFLCDAQLDLKHSFVQKNVWLKLVI